MRDATTGQPLLSQFWDGEGSHTDFTNPAAIAWWQSGLEREVLDVGIDAGWNDNNEYELWDEDAECEGFGTAARLALLRPIQPLLMTRTTLEAQRRRTPGERALHRDARRLPGHPALRTDLEWRQQHELGLAALEPAHRPADVAVRHVQYRPRHRRLLRPDPGPGAADPLDPGGRRASALHHEQLEAGGRV